MSNEKKTTEEAARSAATAAEGRGKIISIDKGQ
jgi:hypothetical protein